MAQLGFTFYPKDWWASDSFYILAPFERYIYLELLFMMYSNDGFVSNNKGMIEARLRTTIRDDVWVKITELLVEDGDMLTHKSVNSRLAKTLANRENGKKGGAPKGNRNALKQPKQPNKTTQNNPPLEIESEIESEIEDIIPPNIPLSEDVVIKTWRDDFKIYLSNVTDAYNAIVSDNQFIKEREKYHPNLDVPLSLEKSFKDYWSTEAAWKKRKRSQTKELDWKATFRNSLDQKFNHVYKQKAINNEQPKSEPRLHPALRG